MPAAPTARRLLGLDDTARPHAEGDGAVLAELFQLSGLAGLLH